MTFYSLWLAEPNFVVAEVAFACNIQRLVIDIEHGIHPVDQLFGFIAYAKAKGANVLAKVAGPSAEAIQQAIDFGVDGVIIPHVRGVEHAREICQVSKFTPLGTRSYAGGRTLGYMPPKPDYLKSENRRVQCYPMIETPEALADVEKILALDCVDGIFPGPTDLAITQGQGIYTFDGKSQADLTRCANAANHAEKKWIMPAWTTAERKFAAELNAHEIVAFSQTMVLRSGIQQMQQALKDEGFLA